jgi:hypothetical protein
VAGQHQGPAPAASTHTHAHTRTYTHMRAHAHTHTPTHTFTHQSLQANEEELPSPKHGKPKSEDVPQQSKQTQQGVRNTPGQPRLLRFS